MDVSLFFLFVTFPFEYYSLDTHSIVWFKVAGHGTSTTVPSSRGTLGFMPYNRKKDGQIASQPSHLVIYGGLSISGELKTDIWALNTNNLTWISPYLYLICRSYLIL